MPKKKAPTPTTTLSIEEEGAIAPEHLLIINNPICAATIDVDLILVALPECAVAEARVTIVPLTPSVPTLDPDEHLRPEPHIHDSDLVCPTLIALEWIPDLAS
jgi:hypothetical protein